MQSTHPRLDELEASYRWSRDKPSDFGPYPSNHEARTIIDGRTVILSCYRYRREGLRWGCGAVWRSGMPRRQRKEAKKRLVELVAVALDPAARSLLESIRHPSHAGVEDGFHAGTGALAYGAPGDPPSAETVISIAKMLAEMADKIETILDTP